MVEAERGLRKAWEGVRRDMGHPALREPVLEDTGSVGTAYIDMAKKRIVVDPKFITRIRRPGEEDDHVHRLVQMHEVGHYRYHPYDAVTVLREINALMSFEGGSLDKDAANGIRLLFDDVVDNSFLILNNKGEEISELYARMVQGKPPGKALSLTLAYYSAISGLDFGVGKEDLDPGLAGKLDLMQRIDFLDRGNVESNITRFARIITDINEEQGGGGGAGESGCGGVSIESFGKDEVEKALKRLARELTPEEFRKLSEAVGASVTDDVSASVEHYKSIASQYPLKVLGAPIARADGLYPERMTEWQVGDDFRKINPYRSFGIIAPGITKRWVYSPGEAHGEQERVPDSIIILDSSGSQVNPVTQTSTAVVGAFAVAMAYLRNGATVDVINFSEKSSVKTYSRDDLVYRELVRYFGEGTQPPVRQLAGLVRDGSKDVTVITDGFAGARSDVEEFMRLLDEIGRTNRVSFINMGAIPENVGGYGNVTYHEVSRNEDIGAIIIGDLRW